MLGGYAPLCRPVNSKFVKTNREGGAAKAFANGNMEIIQKPGPIAAGTAAFAFRRAAEVIIRMAHPGDDRCADLFLCLLLK